MAINSPTLAVLLILSPHAAVAQRQAVSLCDGPIRAAECAPIEVIPKCDYTGRWCYLYDAMAQFCPEPHTFFDAAEFGSPRAEGPAVCTTTTTTTYTVTSTTTISTTIFTTTQPQPVECRSFCYENSHPWLVKCGWAVCASCTECASVVQPTTPAPPAPPIVYIYEQRIPTSNATNASTTTEQPESGNAQQGNAGTVSDGSLPDLTENLAGSLSEAVAQSQTAPPAVPTTTVRELVSKTCLRLCYDAMQDNLNWDLLCNWATCVACPECSGTTTTGSTTSVEITKTTTMSSTGTTLFPPTFTKTSTGTRSSSTYTVTSTTTYTSTTTDRPCTGPSPVLTGLMASKVCTQNLSSGDFCPVEIVKHPCLHEGELVFECPRNNIYYREPVLLSGSYQHKCKICGFEDEEWVDTDWRAGSMTVKLRFGANALSGDLNEDVINGYGIFIVDNCSRILVPEMVGYLPKMDPYPYDRRCCTMGAYEINVSFKVPPDYMSAILMVRVNTSTVGFLPVGDVTSEIMDWNDTTYGYAGAVRCSDFSLATVLLNFLLGSLLAWQAACLDLTALR